MFYTVKLFLRRRDSFLSHLISGFVSFLLSLQCYWSGTLLTTALLFSSCWTRVSPLWILMTSVNTWAMRMTSKTTRQRIAHVWRGIKQRTKCKPTRDTRVKRVLRVSRVYFACSRLLVWKPQGPYAGSLALVYLATRLKSTRTPFSTNAALISLEGGTWALGWLCPHLFFLKNCGSNSLRK